MRVPKQEWIEDDGYRKSFQGETCWSCGAKDDTVIGAHIRWYSGAGMGRKPSDDQIIPLCYHCHKSESEWDGPKAEWYAAMVKRMAKRRYNRWRWERENE